MKLVLDTSALWHAPLMKALAEARACGIAPETLSALVPAIAYAERVRQLRRDGRDVAVWRENLATAGIEVEPFSQQRAEALPQGAIDDEEWERHARDFLIASHAGEGRLVVTKDRGAAWAGVAARTPEEATRDVQAYL